MRRHGIHSARLPAHPNSGGVDPVVTPRGDDADGLAEMVAGSINAGEDIPMPAGEAEPGEHRVTIEPLSAKAAELVGRLDCDEKEVRQLLDPRQRSIRLPKLQQALAALGKRLMVEMQGPVRRPGQGEERRISDDHVLWRRRHAGVSPDRLCERATDGSEPGRAQRVAGGSASDCRHSSEEEERTKAGKQLLDAVYETIADLERAAADTEAGSFHDAMQRQGMRIHVPETVDVKAIRQATGLSQARFAERFGFDLASIRNWEQGRRRPEGPARVLLMVIKHNPQAVQDALAV